MTVSGNTISGVHSYFLGGGGHVYYANSSGTLVAQDVGTYTGSPGTYYVGFEDAAGQMSTQTVTLSGSLTYTISASTLTSFGSLQTPYTQPASQTVTITNTGTGSVTLTQPTATNYDIGTLSTTTLAAGATATFTVRPKAGLSVGNHDETITISGSNGASATVNASFTVTAAQVAPTITSSNSTSVISGTGGTFQVTATGNPNTFTYSLSGQPTGVSMNSSSGLMSIAGTVAAGTYTYTVTVSNGVNPNATQSFTLTVNAIPVVTYTLTVNNGSGGGNYEAGTVVNISANAAPSGQEFDQWTGDVAGVANVTAPNTTYTVGNANAVVTATYKLNTGIESVQSGIKIYAEGSSIRIESGDTMKSVEIYNLLGQAIRLIRPDSNRTKIDNLPTGVLVVKVTMQNGESETKKVQIGKR